jgi:hypothetical protein
VAWLIPAMLFVTHKKPTLYDKAEYNKLNAVLEKEQKQSNIIMNRRLGL